MFPPFCVLAATTVHTWSAAQSCLCAVSRSLLQACLLQVMCRTVCGARPSLQLAQVRLASKCC